MPTQKSFNILLTFFILLLFLGVLTVNTLANALPINGITTGALSDLYPNLFVPAGLTFSIWGLIYLLLLFLVIIQIYAAVRERSGLLLPRKAQILLALNFALNIGWIFLWHYQKIFGSLLLMLGLLITLILLFRMMGERRPNTLHLLAQRAPISIYYGWISVATIANVTALLVARGWGAWGIPDPVWTILLMAVGTLLALLMLWKHQCLLYALTIVWAYLGIIIKRNTQDIVYRDIITAAAVFIAIILLFALYVLLRERKAAKA